VRLVTRISLLILMVILISGVLNIYLIRHQSTEFHIDSEKIFSQTITQSLSKTLVQDIIDGNTLKISNELRKLTLEDNPIVFLFIKKNGKIVAHSFLKGFPKYLVNQRESKDISGIALVNKYQLRNTLIHEYVADVIPGMDVQLYVGISQTRFLQDISETNNQVILMSILILIFSLLIAFIWAGTFTRPLIAFTRLIQQYGEGKNIEVDVLKNADSELQNLGDIFQKAIEQRNNAENALIRQANYDALTDLPNRFLTTDRLFQQLKIAKREDGIVAVIFLDLDDFKKINDSLGHEVGDKLLVQVSERLNSMIRGEDTIGRLGGDEFIGIFGRLKSVSDAGLIAQNITTLFVKSFKVDGNEFNVSASVGIALYPDDGELPVDLLRKADLAMYHAKSKGRSQFCFHSKSMSSAVKRRIDIEVQMALGFELKEFAVYYQPKIDINTGKVIGVEALLRWFNPSLGSVAPEEFIAVAEKNGFIHRLGMFVFQEAIQTIVNVNEQLSVPISIAINLSPSQLSNDRIVTEFHDVIKHEGISANLVELEITENVLLQGSANVLGILERFNQLGLKISMDDFGTGYSSLSYLQKFPFDIIKIDRLFVRNILSGKHDLELVNAIILMAHALELIVVAEGVETTEQLEALQELGCDVAQGYLLSKPIGRNELYQFLSIEG